MSGAIVMKPALILRNFKCHLIFVKIVGKNILTFLSGNENQLILLIIEKNDKSKKAANHKGHKA
jgi:hypothetical protein